MMFPHEVDGAHHVVETHVRPVTAHDVGIGRTGDDLGFETLQDLQLGTELPNQGVQGRSVGTKVPFQLGHVPSQLDLTGIEEALSQTGSVLRDPENGHLLRDRCFQNLAESPFRMIAESPAVSAVKGNLPRHGFHWTILSTRKRTSVRRRDRKKNAAAGRRVTAGLWNSDCRAGEREATRVRSSYFLGRIRTAVPPCPRYSSRCTAFLRCFPTAK